jgi:hypothetical protein
MFVRRVLAGILLVTSIAVAEAQPPLVPAGMGGCPSAWGHRDGDERSFGCRDTQGSGFCSGRRSGGVSADPVGDARTRIVQMGFTITSEGDDGGLHWFVYADSSGNQILQLVAHDLVVTCGSAPADFARLRSTFLDVAHAAH